MSIYGTVETAVVRASEIDKFVRSRKIISIQPADTLAVPTQDKMMAHGTVTHTTTRWLVVVQKAPSRAEMAEIATCVWRRWAQELVGDPSHGLGDNELREAVAVMVQELRAMQSLTNEPSVPKSTLPQGRCDYCGKQSEGLYALECLAACSDCYAKGK